MSETDHYWTIRIDARGDSHPNYVGPLNYGDAQELAGRLSADRRSFEMAPLLTEVELPGLWSPVRRPESN